MAQTVKRLPATWEIRVRSLGWEDPWRRKWQPTPVSLAGESHGWRSLVGYSPQGRKESDMTEWLHFTLTIINFFSFIFISWRLITLQYFSGFSLTWISHGFTCVPHPDPLFLLPPHPIPLGHPSAPALSTCLMHPTWTGSLFHPW